VKGTTYSEYYTFDVIYVHSNDSKQLLAVTLPVHFAQQYSAVLGFKDK